MNYDTLHNYAGYGMCSIVYCRVYVCVCLIYTVYTTSSIPTNQMNVYYSKAVSVPIYYQYDWFYE